MGQLICHGVKIRWNDGHSELFRYETEEQARRAERYHLVENWQATRSAAYVGRRLNWTGMWHAIFG